MQQHCSYCNEVGTIEYESASGHSVCISCGNVAEENVVVSEKDLGGTTFLSASYFNNRSRPDFDLHRRIGYKWQSTQSRSEGAKEAAKYIPQILASLGLPVTMDEDAKAVLRQLLTTSNAAKTWRGQHGFQILAAACVYVACKKNRKPVLMADIAASVRRNPYEFGRSYKKLLDQLKAHTLATTHLPGPANVREEDFNRNNQNDPEHLISHTCCKKLDKIVNDNATLQKVSTLATKIARLAQMESLLGTGRKPAAVVVASIAIAASAFGFVTKDDVPSSKKRKVSSSEPASDDWNTIFEDLCKSLSVASKTALRRKREIEEVLVKKAKSMQLPWAESIDRKNLHHNLQFMMKNLDFVTNVAMNTKDDQILKDMSTGALPPSYLYQEKLRNDRAEKLKRAKATITTILRPTEQQTPSRSAEVLPSEEDLLIMQCLLEGAEEIDILEGHYETLLVECKAKRQKLNVSEESELNDADLSEKELNEFIRSPEEVKRLQPLMIEDNNESKK